MSEMDHSLLNLVIEMELYFCSNYFCLRFILILPFFIIVPEFFIVINKRYKDTFPLI